MLFRKKKESKGDAEAEFPNIPTAQAEPGIPSSLVAVIAAAIASETGRAPGTFRIASIAPTGCDSGFNTPAWGRVERLYRA